MLEPPTNTEGTELEIMGDSKTVGEWINGKAKQKTTVGPVRVTQNQLREWWPKASIYAEECTHFRENNKEADVWAEREVRWN